MTGDLSSLTADELYSCMYRGISTTGARDCSGGRDPNGILGEDVKRPSVFFFSEVV